MKKLFKSGLVAAVIALVFQPVYSQVPVQWSRTLQLEGYWEGPVTLILGGQSFNLSYHTDFKSDLDGLALYMIEDFSDPALGDFKGVNLIGLSAADGLIRWSSVDNFGTAHEHTGSWLNPKHFYMEHHSLQGGQAYAEFIHIRLRANNQKVLLSLIATLDADTVEILTGTLFLQNNCNKTGNGIAETLEPDEINVYPNPTSGDIEITSNEMIKEVKIISQSGAVVYHSMHDDTDLSLQIDSKLPEGVYFVQIISANKSETKKIVLTR